MALPSVKEMRRHTRTELTGALPGVMKADGESEPLQVRPVDVSEQGLGLVTSRCLEPGSSICIEMPNGSLEFEVVWYKRQNSGGPEAFHIGLLLKTRDINLVEVFQQAGGFIDQG